MKIKDLLYKTISLFTLVLIVLILILTLFDLTPRRLLIHPGVLAIGLAVFIFSVVLLVRSKWLEKLFKRKHIFIVVLSMLAVFPRLLWILSVNVEPFSDFLHLHDYGVSASQGSFTDFMDFYKLFPFKFSFGLVIAGLYKLFGADPIVIKLFNVLISLGIVFLVLWIGKAILGEKAGKSAAVLTALWPAQIMYCGVLAAEHIFLAFFLAGIGLFIKASKSIELKKSLAFGLISGVLIAVAQLFRPIATMLFPVFVVYLFAFSENDRPMKKAYALKSILFGVFVLGFAFLTALYSIPAKSITGVEVWRSSPGVNLLIGTNKNHNGFFNYDDWSIVEEFNYEYGKVHSEATRRAVDRIKSDPVEFLGLAVRKYSALWADENYGYYWSVQKAQPYNLLGEFAIDKPRGIAVLYQGFYLMVLVFAAIGAFYTWRHKNFKFTVFAMIFLCLAVSYTFLEIQPRYHIPAIPIFFPLAGFGLEKLQCHLLLMSGQE